MKNYYELHITMVGEPDHLRPLVEGVKWKFSAIDGDPVLGDGVKCYATTFFNIKKSELDVIGTLIETSALLSRAGAKVIRKKVEKVLFDDRSEAVPCNGACVGCHLDDYNELEKK